MNFHEIADAVMNASPADETEVLAMEQDESLTRFANNCVHQNVTERNVQITVRAVKGTKIGIAVSNDIRPDRLRELAARAHEVAKLQPDNPEFKGLPAPQPIVPVAAFDSIVAECSPEQRAQHAGLICRKAASAGCSAAGSVISSSFAMGVANSKGVFAEHRSTMADASTVIMGNNASGWAQSTGWQWDAIHPESLADEALSKVRMGRDPVDFDADEYPVILDPYAVADILEMLAFDGMGALAVQEGRSWMNGRLGQRIMADSVSIVDDGLSIAGIPWPFDFEGVPKNVMPIVSAGVVLTPVYDSFTAGREEGKQSTGHATPPSPQGRFGPAPMNLFLRPGTTSLDAMMKSTKLGLYITRFWYTRTVHPRDAVVTGMTRDGTFVIRNGEIAHPVKSLRFTQSYVEALKYAEAIGTTPRLLRSGFGGATSVPALKLARFRFYELDEVICVIIEVLLAIVTFSGNQGSAVQLTFPNEQGIKSVEVVWETKKIPAFRLENTWTTILGVDLDAKPGDHKTQVLFTMDDGRVDQRETVIQVVPKKYPTTELKVDDKYVELSKTDLARANRESRETAAIYARISNQMLWNEPFSIPIAGETSGTNFGHRRIFNGEPRAPHAGADLRARTGTGIHATNRGRVVLAKNLFFTGNTVILDHGLGIYSLYAHLSRIDVKLGDMVDNGGELGLSGATGRVTGPHLHWGIMAQGARVDPFTLVNIK